MQPGFTGQRVDSHLEWDVSGDLLTAQKGEQLKCIALCIFGIFHLIFLDHG